MTAAINATIRRWRRLPAATRADFLAYLRDEAADFVEQAKGTEMIRDVVDPASLRRWARANQAVVDLVVAVAGEPKPQAKKPRRPMPRRKSRRRMAMHKWNKVEGSSWMETCACGALRNLPASGPCLYSSAGCTTWTQEEPPHDEQTAMVT